MEPRITVLMAIYNCAPTLIEALDSLMNQTYQRFKVILCDDASTDNTYVVAKEYAEKHPDKFILIRNEENKKLPCSLNRCLEYADTEYVARMDGDDISLPERFEKEIDFLDKNPEYALVSVPMIRFDENGIFSNPTNTKQYSPKPKDFVHGSPFCHAPCMARTEVFKKVKGYNEKIARGQDYDLWFRIYEAGFKGMNLAEPLYMMRDDKNATARRTLKSQIGNAKTMSRGFRKLNLPFYFQLYALRPIVVGLLPSFIYNYFHRKKLS